MLDDVRDEVRPCCRATVDAVARAGAPATCPACGVEWAVDPVEHAAHRASVVAAADLHPDRSADCGVCDATIDLVRHDGADRRCGGCGTLYQGDPAARLARTLEAPPAPPSRLLAAVLAALGPALAVERELRADNRLPHLAPVNPLGRLMATAGGATHDATDADVRGRSWLLREGVGRTADRARAEFVARTLRYCEETSRPSDLPDGESPEARARAERDARRLAALDETHQEVLRTVARGGTAQGWDEAAARVVDDVLPRPAVQAYRRDPASARALTVRRTMEAEVLLRAALAAWEAT